MIFLDFNMPRIGGIEATNAIRHFLLYDQKIQKEDLPIIIGLTAHDMKSASFVGEEAGMDNIYQKPLRYYDLKQLLQLYFY